MRSVCAFFVVAAIGVNLASVRCFGQDTAPSAKATIEKWAKALTSNDPADSLHFYADSDDLVVIFSSGHQLKGYGLVKTLYTESARRIAFYESEVSELAIQQQGDMAWATCRHRARYRDLADDTKTQLEVRTTFVLKRTKDAWQIVLEHSSPIADVPREKPVPQP
jgi:ketosteroid isomerase-like protein